MKVVALNGSARKDGNTAILLNLVLDELKKEGIQTELVQLAVPKAKVAYFYAQQEDNDTKRHPSGFKSFFDWL